MRLLRFLSAVGPWYVMANPSQPGLWLSSRQRAAALQGCKIRLGFGVRAPLAASTSTLVTCVCGRGRDCVDVDVGVAAVVVVFIGVAVLLCGCWDCCVVVLDGRWWHAGDTCVCSCCSCSCACCCYCCDCIASRQGVSGGVFPLSTRFLKYRIFTDFLLWPTPETQLPYFLSEQEVVPLVNARHFSHEQSYFVRDGVVGVKPHFLHPSRLHPALLHWTPWSFLHVLACSGSRCPCHRSSQKDVRLHLRLGMPSLVPLASLCVSSCCYCFCSCFLFVIAMYVVVTFVVVLVLVLVFMVVIGILLVVIVVFVVVFGICCCSSCRYCCSWFTCITCDTEAKQCLTSTHYHGVCRSERQQKHSRRLGE